MRAEHPEHRRRTRSRLWSGAQDMPRAWNNKTIAGLIFMENPEMLSYLNMN